ncbi:alcohol dehydrogenase catalytic domain-containing protein [Halobacillus kuroshimensis]|uniref:Alcohol dehydrogenase catalytic domain-containing protein n=1 Tax=Halobacillus kuroshimensis TaxID=302481 RepID=A0ABS3E0T9_9BACI|nr:zinc-binding alcohol dehydrogenase [Halobacillus kuroshimensis]MBN8237208.1 alcohol dehydrogenase catalytic domain-containing protein [Halobacillus kuroshimensis]
MKQKSLILTGPKNLIWETCSFSPLKKDEVSIKTIAGAISIGAELPQYNESDVTDSHPTYPRETGYESYGEVLEVGSNVTQVKVGDHVLAFYGHKDLAIVKPNKIVAVPKQLDYKYALLNTLSCDAAKGVLKLNPERVSRVLVTGGGTMGILAVHFLKRYMNVSHVDMLESNKQRHVIPKRIGVDNVFSTKNEVSEHSYDYALECSSSFAAFKTLLRSMKSEGKVSILSDGNKDLFHLTEDFYTKELTIVGSSDGWNYHKHADWFFKEYQSSSFLKDVFEHEVSQEDLIHCFDELHTNQISPMKVLVHYNRTV